MKKSKLAGYIILVISIILWGLIAVIPFMGYSGVKTAGIITILIVFGEITFYLSIFLIGKDFLIKIKHKSIKWFNNTFRKNKEEL